MKKPLSPIATTVIAVVAVLIVLAGGLAYLNRPSGGLTDEEVRQFQQKPEGASLPASAPTDSSGPSSSDFPPGGPGGAPRTNP